MAAAPPSRIVFKMEPLPKRKFVRAPSGLVLNAAQPFRQAADSIDEEPFPPQQLLGRGTMRSMVEGFYSIDPKVPLRQRCALPPPPEFWGRMNSASSSNILVSIAQP